MAFVMRSRLHFERHLHLVADLLVGGGAQVEVYLICSAGSRSNSFAPAVGVVPDLDLELEQLARLGLERLDDPERGQDEHRRERPRARTGRRRRRARPPAAHSMTPASFGILDLRRGSAPGWRRRRCRTRAPGLLPTTSITTAPMTARMIWVWMTASWRGGVPRRFGRSASIAPSAAASGSRTRACRISSSGCRRAVTPVCARRGRCGSCDRAGCIASSASGAPAQQDDGQRPSAGQQGRVEFARSSSECQPFVDLLFEPADEPVRDVAARSRRRGMRPAIAGRSAGRAARRSSARRPAVMSVDERPVPAAIVEPDVLPGHALDERRLLEHLDVAARRVEHAGAAERLPQVARDVPAATRPRAAPSACRARSARPSDPSCPASPAARAGRSAARVPTNGFW